MTRKPNLAKTEARDTAVGHGKARSPKWPHVEKLHLKLEPACAACGSVKKLNVHHKDRNRKNNDYSNLEVLCPNCHSIEHMKHIDKSLLSPVFKAYAYNGGIGFTRRLITSGKIFLPGKYEPYLSMELVWNAEYTIVTSNSMNESVPHGKAR